MQSWKTTYEYYSLVTGIPRRFHAAVVQLLLNKQTEKRACPTKRKISPTSQTVEKNR